MEKAYYQDLEIESSFTDKSIKINCSEFQGELTISKTWLMHKGIKLEFKNSQAKSLEITKASEYDSGWCLILDSRGGKKEIGLNPEKGEIDQSGIDSLKILILLRDYAVNQFMSNRHKDDCLDLPGRKIGRCCEVHKEIYETRLWLMYQARKLKNPAKRQIFSQKWWEDQGIVLKITEK